MGNSENKEDNGKKLLELREKTGMSRKEFCEYFEIPYRTMQDWELGNRKIPSYLLRLMTYKIRTEQLLKENHIDPDQTDRIRRDGEHHEEER